MDEKNRTKERRKKHEQKFLMEARFPAHRPDRAPGPTQPPASYATRKSIFPELKRQGVALNSRSGSSWPVPGRTLPFFTKQVCI
jgi:hypothetical protein